MQPLQTTLEYNNTSFLTLVKENVVTERRAGKVTSDKLCYGKRDRGRQRETFLTYLGKMKHTFPMELLQMAKNRTVWFKLCTISGYDYEQDTK